MRADRPQPLAYPHRSSDGGLRLYRRLLQSTPPPLRARLSQSSKLREETLQPDHRGLIATRPRERGNSRAAAQVLVVVALDAYSRSGWSECLLQGLEQGRPVPAHNPALKLTQHYQEHRQHARQNEHPGYPPQTHEQDQQRRPCQPGEEQADSKVRLRQRGTEDHVETCPCPCA